MSRSTVVALLAFLAFVSLGLPDGLLGVSWPSISDAFGVPLGALGVLVAFQTAGYLTSSSLSGRILRVLTIGSVLALSTLATALATSAPASSTGCTPSSALGPPSVR